jgi:hypothetical protein
MRLPCPWQELRLPFYLSIGGRKMVKSERESYLGERKKEGKSLRVLDHKR